MKKRIFAIITVLFICVSLDMPSFAEETVFTDTVAVETSSDITVETKEIAEVTTEAAGSLEEKAEPTPETTETMVSESSEALADDLPDGIENVDKEQLISIINGLSGEGVNKMQKLLLAGINSVERGQSTTWDKVADFCERHIEGMSLIAFAIVGIVYIFVRVKSNKKLRNDIGIATNNAVETVEIAKQMNADSVTALEKNSQSINAFKNCLESAEKAMVDLMEENRRKSAENEALRDALKHNSAADMLLADTVNELLQLAKIPQNKKDAIYSKITAAKALIKSEGKTDEGKNKKTDKASVV